MKRFMYIMSLIAITLVFTFSIRSCNKTENQYQIKYGNYWSLYQTAPTIESKAVLLKAFIESLEKSEMVGDYDAIKYKSPDNSFSSNFQQIKELQVRLDSAYKMDPLSVDYQTAMMQINEQSEHPAKVIQSIYWKQHNILFWSWIEPMSFFILLLCIVYVIVCVGYLFSEWDWID